MFRKMMVTILAFVFGVSMVVGLSSPASATGDEPCVPTENEFVETDWLTERPEGEGWKVLESRVVIDENGYIEDSGWVTVKPEGEGWELVEERTVVDKPASTEEVFDYWQRYSFNGPWESNTEAPPFPDERWQPNVKGDPHGVGKAGAYYRSNGNSGNGDWFYLEAVTKTVETPAVTHQEYRYEREVPLVLHKEYRYGRWVAGTDCPNEPPVVEPPVDEPKEPREPNTPVSGPDNPNRVGPPVAASVPTVVDAGLVDVEAKKKSVDFDLDEFPLWLVISIIILVVVVFVVKNFLD